MEDIVSEASKEKAKKQLVVLDKLTQTLEASVRVVKVLKTHAIDSQSHKRAIHARTALTGLEELLEDIRVGRLMCIDVLGAKKVPIVIEKKLKLVVNNTGGK